ncbi:sensor histidine kinase [Luteimonas huabeiensis]|uniref:sensor histidine kinase n=1 Tax=Luteimonas huabeiensis TaxID=1244513 RepID=UPI0004646838|nr:HAMP domain-containing sensor histidine kinase [Luteimonas huabeiensis]
MKPRPSLRTRVLYWLAGYALLLAAGISLHGLLINEYAERLLWDTLIQNEFDRHLERRASDPGYRWADSQSLRLYVDGGASPLPAAFERLPDGIHDDLTLADGREVLALLRHVDGVRHAMALDITEMEREEDRLALFILGSAVLLVTLTGLAMAFGLGRALRPLADMAAAIQALAPDRSGQRIVPGARASSELIVIAGALNDYLQRNERFVERERTFVRTASHELRTPVAVLEGAAELALQAPGIPAATEHQLRRIQRTARDMEQLIALLLALAKDPSRLAQAGQPIALERLLPQIVDDHLHLTAGKALTVAIAVDAPCEIVAPPGIVRAAIGNLLRNAIEHSDDGRIDVELGPGATVVIRDPGHGMDPARISAIYSRLARGGAATGDGIGLDLIARLCEHLGWTLDIDSGSGQGTTVVLGLRAALRVGDGEPHRAGSA